MTRDTFGFGLALTLILLVAWQPTAAQPETVRRPGAGAVVVWGGGWSADNYLNVDGTLKGFDTMGTHYTRSAYTLDVRYGLFERVEVELDVPLMIQSLTSTIVFPDRRIVAPAYYGIGATYWLSDSLLTSGASLTVRIPHGFHQGIYDDPEHPTFLSDGFLQATAMLRAGFRYNRIWMKGAAGYTWRAEEPLDEIPFEFQMGLSRVEGTGIFVGLTGVASTGDVTQPLRPFYAGASGSAEERDRKGGGQGVFRTIDRENYLSFNAGAYVHLFDRWLISGRYDLRLFGRNTLALRGAELGIGYVF